MATELTELDLFEVSLVDAGDDPLAKVALYKRKETSDMTEKVEKTTEQFETEIADLTSQVETLKNKVAELEAAEVEKSKKEEEMLEVDGEMIAKSAIPAPVLKQLEKVQKEKEELEKAAAEQALIEKAKAALPNFKGTDTQKARLYKSVADDKELLEMLAAADALFAELFKEKGTIDTEGVMKDAKQRLDDMVKQYDATHKVGYYKAYAAVVKTQEGKALLLESNKKE